MINNDYIIILKRHWLGSTFFLLSTATLAVSLNFFFSSQESYKKSAMLLQQAQSKNREAQIQTDRYHEFIPTFTSLQLSGFIGNNKRLQWLETLQDTSTLYKIPKLDFTIDESIQAEESTEFYSHEQLKFETTEMNLKFQLMHEGDFYRLMRKLHTSAKGIFSTEHCFIQIDSRPLKSTTLNELNGQCDLRWYSLIDITQHTNDSL